MTGSRLKAVQIADLTVRALRPGRRASRKSTVCCCTVCAGRSKKRFFGKAWPRSTGRQIISGSDLPLLAAALKDYQAVFTNGCFDILLPGNVFVINESRKFGELLIVGLYTDASIKRLKGPTRPYHSFADRAMVLAALECVDYVVGFDEDTPENLIKTLTPKILVKGGDYTPATIVGADWVTGHGGCVKVVPLLEGHSTTGIHQWQRQISAVIRLSASFRHALPRPGCRKNARRPRRHPAGGRDRPLGNGEWRFRRGIGGHRFAAHRRRR